MNKILRLFVCIALIASTLLLSSCGPLFEDFGPEESGDDFGENNHDNDTGDSADTEKQWETTKYSTFVSPYELAETWKKINHDSGKVYEEYYVVPEDFGEDYIAIYSMMIGDCGEYPNLEFVQLFMLNTTSDMCETHVGFPYDLVHVDVSVANPDYQETYDRAQGHLFVTIHTVEYVEITDPSLLSVSEPTEGHNIYWASMSGFSHPIAYHIYYGDVRIACVTSCILLDEDFVLDIAKSLRGMYSYLDN